MKASEALLLHRSEIVRIVASHRVSNPRIFGSVLHGSDADGSDLNILADEMSKTTLFDIGAIQGALL